MFVPPGESPRKHHPTGESSRARRAAIDIIRRLREAGHTAYFAGGCVRDELLGMTPEDYDVATDATPKRVTELFRNTRIVGKSFGVVPVKLSGIVVEVATFRRESGYTDKRRPDVVEFCDDTGDARRRDFTINALFLDPLDTRTRPGGRIIDHVGGVADLDARLLRAVGDPDARLAEDHLRALRQVRFTARLGFTLDPATAAAVSRHARELAGVSRERIGDELRRMLAHPSRAVAVKLIEQLGLDAPVLNEPAGGIPGENSSSLLNLLTGPIPFAAALGGWMLDRLARAQGVQGAALRPEAIKSHAPHLVASLRKALVLSNAERDELSGMLHGIPMLEQDWDAQPVAKQKRAASSGWFGPALVLVRARSGAAAANVERRRDELARSPGGLAPRPLVDGDALIQAGLRPGKQFGDWLYRVYDEQLEGRITTVREGVELVLGWAGKAPEGEPRPGGSSFGHPNQGPSGIM